MFVCPECGLAQAAPGACPTDGAALAPRGDDLLVGQTVGVYRIARLLGVGGMGRVYKGVHPTIGSRVAVKVLSRECADRPDLVERFFSEARAVNLIRHEGLVNVLDLATLPDGRPFIIMEYLDGSPLTELIARLGPAPLGGLARLFAEVLDALGAAHAKGIVHRDLKPDNIFITPGGRPKILDFGIAKLRPELGGGSTQTGSLLGTPHYMAPEQALSRPIDQRTDLYAIGVILYECATGQRPFHSDSLFDLLRKHVDEPPPPPRALRPDIPPDYEHVILQSLAKAPEHRFQTAHALAQALLGSSQSLGPDQWLPISPATAAQFAAQRTPVSGGGWRATPPGPTPRSTPGPTPPPPTVPTPPPSTVSSGQVDQRPSAGSRIGKVLGALVLVGAGAGIAIAVTQARGGSPPETPTPATPPSPTALPAPPPSNPVVVTVAPTPDAEPAEAPDEPDEDDAAEDEKEAKALEAEVRRAQKQIKRQLELAKVPELDKLAEELAGVDPEAQKAVDKGKQWIATQQSLTRDVHIPPGFDARAADVGKLLGLAEAEVKKVYPDALLFRIDADGVGADGKANLTLADGMYLDYRFVSPAHSKRPADVPLGVDWEEKCILRMWVEPHSIEVRPLTGWECDEVPVRKPRCSAAQVWKKAIERGAPKDAVAELGYRADFSKKPVWYFSVKGTGFSEIFQDDC